MIEGSLSAPITVVRFTVNGDEAMYRLYKQSQYGKYASDQSKVDYFDAELEEHMSHWAYHSHQQIYL